MPAIDAEVALPVAEQVGTYGVVDTSLDAGSWVRCQISEPVKFFSRVRPTAKTRYIVQGVVRSVVKAPRGDLSRR